MHDICGENCRPILQTCNVTNGRPMRRLDELHVGRRCHTMFVDVPREKVTYSDLREGKSMQITTTIGSPQRGTRTLYTHQHV